MKFSFIASDPRNLAGGLDMRGARCLAWRVLCVARAPAERAYQGQDTFVTIPRHMIHNTLTIYNDAMGWGIAVQDGDSSL